VAAAEAVVRAMLFSGLGSIRWLTGAGWTSPCCGNVPLHRGRPGTGSALGSGPQNKYDMHALRRRPSGAA
jgi:hypothetical protein